MKLDADAALDPLKSDLALAESLGVVADPMYAVDKWYEWGYEEGVTGETRRRWVFHPHVVETWRQSNAAKMGIEDGKGDAGRTS